MLVLSPQENSAHVENTALYHYTYVWPLPAATKGCKAQAAVFGLGSMFNHSSRGTNVGWQRDVERGLMIYRSLREIKAGEELVVHYGDQLTFVDADSSVDDAEYGSGQGPQTDQELLSAISLCDDQSS